MNYSKPIQTLEQAKQFYCDFGCNGFHMSREHPERYKEFEALNISEQTKTAWRKEAMQHLFNLAVKNKRKDNSLLLETYFQFSDDFTSDDVRKVYRLLKASYRHISPLYNVVVAETICNARGLHPMGCLALTRKFEMNGWFEKYHRLVKKMLIFACVKDESLTDRASKVFARREEQVKEAREIMALINEKMEEMKKNEAP